MVWQVPWSNCKPHPSYASFVHVYANKNSKRTILRAFQGTGATGIYSMVLAVAPTLVPREKFGKYMGIVSSVFAIASVLGPILGGVIQIPRLKPSSPLLLGSTTTPHLLLHLLRLRHKLRVTHHCRSLWDPISYNISINCCDAHEEGHCVSMPV